MVHGRNEACRLRRSPFRAHDSPGRVGRLRRTHWSGRSALRHEPRGDPVPGQPVCAADPAAPGTAGAASPARIAVPERAARPAVHADARLRRMPGQPVRSATASAPDAASDTGDAASDAGDGRRHAGHARAHLAMMGTTAAARLLMAGLVISGLGAAPAHADEQWPPCGLGGACSPPCYPPWVPPPAAGEPAPTFPEPWPPFGLGGTRFAPCPAPDPLPPGPPYPPPPPPPQPWPPCGVGGECWPGGQLPPGWY